MSMYTAFLLPFEKLLTFWVGLQGPAWRLGMPAASQTGNDVIILFYGPSPVTPNIISARWNSPGAGEISKFQGIFDPWIIYDVNWIIKDMLLVENAS